MVIPGVYPLVIKRGDYWALSMTVKVGGTPKDLTGCTVLAQCRRDTQLEQPVLIDLNATLGVGTGVVDLSIDQEIVDVLPVGEIGGWDLQVTDADGRPTTYVEGPVTVTGDYSRDEA